MHRLKGADRKRLALRLSALVLAVSGAAACATNPPSAARGPEIVSPGDSLSGNYLAARHARLEQEPAAAAIFLKQALAISPDDPLLLNRAFSALLLDGRVNDAVVVAREQATSEPSATLAVVTLAVDDIHQQKYDDAIAKLNQLPANSGLWFARALLLAWSQEGAGRPDAAAEALAAFSKSESLQLLPKMHSAWIDDFNGDDTKAADLVRDVLKSQNEPWFRLTELGGEVLERAGDREEAIAAYQRYLDLHPGSTLLEPTIKRLQAGGPPPQDIKSAADGAAEAVFDTVSVLSRQNNRETAIMLGYLGLHLRPNFPALGLVLGDLLDESERYEDANRVYASIDRSSPLSQPARLAMARNYERMEHYDEAAKLLKTLAKEEPDDPDPLSELGDMLRKRERFSEAVTAYDEAFDRIDTLEPRHWRLLYVRGIALERTNEWQRAENDFLKALEFEPEQPFVLNYLGYSWVEQGRNYSEAERMIRRAVELRPNDGYIVDSLGWVLYRLGRYDESVVELEKAVELRPEDPVINDHLGDAYWSVGRQREARFQWREALDLGPDPELRATLNKKLERGLVTANASSR